MQTGKVRGIYLAKKAGESMIFVKSAQVVAGQGLEDDRYFLGCGAYSGSRIGLVRHITLIEDETIEAIKGEYGLDVTAADTRRNVLVRGIALNHLVGKEFRLGAVRIRGVELCSPCSRPGNLSCKDSLKAKDANYPKKNCLEVALMHRGGLRAEALSNGTISVGDDIYVD